MDLSVPDGKEEQREQVSLGIGARAAKGSPRSPTADALRVLVARGLDAPGLRRGKSAATARETISRGTHVGPDQRVPSVPHNERPSSGSR